MSLILTFHINEEAAGMSLLQYLKQQRISKKAIVATKHRGGQLLVNGSVQNVRYQLSLNDQLTVIFPKESRSEGLTPYEYPLDILYEDDYLLVINKPAGLPTIPSIRYPHQTLANALVHYYNRQGLDSTLHFVNRLDKDTSGLLVVAKYRHIHHLMTDEIKHMKRKYYTLVKGDLSGTGTINAPIARLQEGNVKRGVVLDGDDAVTHYRVLEKFSENTLVECTLETGRTHQIRVHLSHLDHPLVGDTLYDEQAIVLSEGHLLHSYFVEFIHPITKELQTFQTPIPKRFYL